MTKIERFLLLANPDENGVSRWVKHQNLLVIKIWCLAMAQGLVLH